MQTTTRNRFDRLTRLLAGAGLTLALGGFTQGSCFGPIDDGEPCGETTCGPGEQCIVLESFPPQYRCLPAPDPQPCASDDECAPDEHCEIDATPSPVEIGCSGAGECPCDDEPPRGVCVPDPASCTSDDECGAGEHCELQSDVVTDDTRCLGPCADGEPCRCGGTPQGVCVPDPTSCTSDSECAPGEICEIDEVPPPCECPAGAQDCVCGGQRVAGVCVPLPQTDPCDGVTCGAGEHCEVEPVECVRAPCPPQPICVPDDPCFGAWVDETGACRAPNDGTYPDACCAGACATDAECGSGGTCWDGLCVTSCPAETDPRVTYVCKGELCWVIDGWICPEGQAPFSNTCGGGCAEIGACDHLDEAACLSDPICDALYEEQTFCDASGACATTRGAFLSCQPIF